MSTPKHHCRSAAGFRRIVSKEDAAVRRQDHPGDEKDPACARRPPPFCRRSPIKAKGFANEVTNTKIREQDLLGETQISREHVRNNLDVRKFRIDRNIRPEALPPAEDLKQVERRLKTEKKPPEAVLRSGKKP